MKTKSFAAIAVVVLGALSFNSCETATGTGAIVGAGTGALIGSGGPGGSRSGALAGAAIGAGAGALIGAAIDADERGYYEGRETSYYPYGRRVGQGLVRSPYPPNALVDVRGIPRDALVRDPATGRPFRKP